jgi:hypothetical protein
MNGDLQVRIETTIDEATAARLQRYCTIHGVTKRDAVRQAIAEMVGRKRSDPPAFNPDQPL